MTCCSSNSSVSDLSSYPRCPNRVGSITVILGPMFSGKTTELLRLHDRQIIAKRNCVLVKYAGDTRYDAELVATHSKVKGEFETVKAHRLAEVRESMFDPNVQVVSIDEGQFFDDLAETCEELAQHGKVVCVAALNGTFERKPFPQISLLLPFANEIKQVTAVCVDCGAQANYSFRSTLDKKVEVIGGSDLYVALCRECYNEKSVEREAKEKFGHLCAKDENEARSSGLVLNDSIVENRINKTLTPPKSAARDSKDSDDSEGSSSPPRKKMILSAKSSLDTRIAH